MKVIVYFNSMSAAGGTERVIASHIDYLSETCRVTLVTKDHRRSFYKLPNSVEHKSIYIDFDMNMNCRWRRIAKITTSLFKTAISLRRQLTGIQPDVLYVASPLNLMESFLAGMKGTRIIVTEHSAFSSYNWVYKNIIYRLYPRVALLTVPTKTDSEGYSARGIRNSYVPNPLPFYPEAVSDLSSKWALCIGRLTADKRHDLLLDIWQLSQIYAQGWKLMIIGEGECESELREKIVTLGLNGHVFIEKPVATIQEKYAASSIFLLTSRAEGFGLVLIEAMAFGIPCISFDCPSGPRDIINNGLTGYLIKEGDVFGYVDVLRRLATNHKHRTLLGCNARYSVLKFRREAVGAEFKKLFNQTFGRNAAE